MATNETRSVVMERDLPYEPEKVWRALTEGQLIKEWLMENDFAPEVGHRFKLRSTPVPGWDGVIESEVLVCEPYTKLSYSWGTMGLATTVDFTLTPTATGTLLRMEHSGFVHEANYKGAQYGWAKFLGGLDAVLAGMDEGGSL
jgi:uncharacterized protein YndB with AHSA1/START domain